MAPIVPLFFNEFETLKTSFLDNYQRQLWYYVDHNKGYTSMQTLVSAFQRQRWENYGYDIQQYETKLLALEYIYKFLTAGQIKLYVSTVGYEEMMFHGKMSQGIVRNDVKIYTAETAKEGIEDLSKRRDYHVKDKELWDFFLTDGAMITLPENERA